MMGALRLGGMITPAPIRAKRLNKDLKTLALFISLYCRHHHGQADKATPEVKGLDVESIAGREISLCADCRKLLTHAFVKRTHCQMDPKPQCKHCPVHCYHATYREQIREVMKFSGKKMLFGGRIDYLFHLLF